MSTDKRIDALEARVEQLADALSRAWERIERGRVSPPQAPQPAPARAEPDLGEHVPAEHAAKLLGVSPKSVRRMVASGRLRGNAARVTGMQRRRWTVEAADLQRLRAERVPTDPPDPRDAEVSSVRSRSR